MTELEKVIKGLTMCRVGHCDYRCPYVDINVGCKNQLNDDALALLKEQEPKNVIAEKRRVLLDDSCDEPRYYEDTFYHCPSCDLILSRTHINNNIHFCNNCGREVKWDG